MSLNAIASKLHCVAHLGALGRMFEHSSEPSPAPESSQINSLFPDDRITAERFLDEEAVQGLLYLLSFVYHSVTVISRRSLPLYKEDVDIVVAALDRIRKVYMRFSGKNIGRDRLADLAEHLIKPILPEGFAPSMSRVAQLVLANCATVDHESQSGRAVGDHSAPT